MKMIGSLQMVYSGSNRISDVIVTAYEQGNPTPLGSDSRVSSLGESEPWSWEIAVTGLDGKSAHNVYYEVSYRTSWSAPMLIKAGERVWSAGLAELDCGEMRFQESGGIVAYDLRFTAATLVTAITGTESTAFAVNKVTYPTSLTGVDIWAISPTIALDFSYTPSAALAALGSGGYALVTNSSDSKGYWASFCNMNRPYKVEVEFAATTGTAAMTIFDTTGSSKTAGSPDGLQASGLKSTGPNDWKTISWSNTSGVYHSATIVAGRSATYNASGNAKIKRVTLYYLP